ncbi:MULTISPECIES: hypothetical protein [Actinomycetes]|nr:MULTISPECIES: hypothetical protein [Nocardia]AXK90084.1 hypothetical protein DXT66_30235 [Nocardia farcinica]MBA4856818.1 hypothetical protein [Nocardia farcinica]MBC9815420.1 hypothetical protein [Nocardia farcinica]MBF6189144.1 hypothetical protein [Nocardia farcinica]MBF6246340.1 hypothetical protein [Nocardia elegans]
MSGFKINRRGIQQMSREIQREFAKNPVRVPIEMEAGGVYPPAANITNYNGPIVTVHGSHAQLAWNNGTVHQGQAHSDQIAPGYEELAATLAELLATLPRFPLADDETTEVREHTETILAEVVNEEPDPGIVKRGLTMIKGLLSPIAAGVTAAATDESAQAAREVIQRLGEAVPF